MDSYPNLSNNESENENLHTSILKRDEKLDISSDPAYENRLKRFTPGEMEEFAWRSHWAILKSLIGGNKQLQPLVF